MTADRPDVAPSVDALVAGATEREAFAPADGKSMTLMERVVIDGERFVLKHLDRRTDWIMRATGDLACRPLVVWQSGLRQDLPDEIDDTMVGASWDGKAGAILMRDVGDQLVPEGDEPLSLAQHDGFLDHMASLHAAFWGWGDTIGLTPLEHRYLEFHPRFVPDTERTVGGTAEVPLIHIPKGWAQFPERAPALASVVLGLHDNLGPLIRALAQTPSTFIQGDWKAGNLGTHPDGRTILLDWAVPGRAPACAELNWYLALNRARLPRSKEDSIDRYRAALETRGIDTSPWWDRQLSLCMLGTMVQFGWEKALGDDDELAWWVARALEGVDHLT